VSAWIVAKAHVDVLVLAGVQFTVPYDLTAAGRGRPPDPVQLAAAGADLWAENHHSINHLYGEDGQPPGYRPPTAEVILDPVAVVKAVDCYVYQSCEHPGWASSRAADYSRRLRTAAMTGLPVERDRGGRPYPVAWDATPWGIDRLTQAAASTRAGSRR
jgi:hypothetical protein